MNTASVGKLRREIAELRTRGDCLSAMAYAISMGGRPLTNDERARLGRLVREWDAIPRSEK